MSTRGVSAVEALVALSLGSWILVAAMGLLAIQRRSAERLLSQADALTARRTARTVLGEELRRGVEDRDWSAVTGDSVRLRAFRGLALVCPAGSPGHVLARYRGSRLPNPRKDSVLVLDPDGVWRAADLVRRRRSALTCPGAPSTPTELWIVDPPLHARSVVRVFETASYHVSGGAFRFRRGLGGRQPITPSVIDGARSGLQPGPRGGLVVTLVTTSPGPGLADGALTSWGRERARD